VAPWAGRLSDSRSPRFVVKLSLAIVLAAFLLFWSAGDSIWGLIVGVIVLDAGVQAAQVANQTRVLSLRPEARNRVNTVYMISYFTGGSIGSLAGSFAWSRAGWSGVCVAGIGFLVLAVIALLSRGPAPITVSSN
jgi:predicted MFS family arabinose efflux permease